MDKITRKKAISALDYATCTANKEQLAAKSTVMKWINQQLTPAERIKENHNYLGTGVVLGVCLSVLALSIILGLGVFVI
ncbi:hypothetical protein [Culicoidibacter larvae]|uniref:Uncharacterized protein n=1 Tax=Culicoidibacter larvae TaxID=2579976 RepID=A0A5R8Q7J9_9FIRM|nr:hypothetical protein [Culicoidibacter larvae]TLG71404.1 hypothetical protein FEZ08_10950 [Culicoidibacter larvae]